MILGRYADDTSIKVEHNGRTYILPSIMLDCGRYNVMDILAKGISCTPGYMQAGEGGYGLAGSSEVRPNLPTAADMALEIPVTSNVVEIEMVNPKIIKVKSDMVSVESFFLSELLMLTNEKKPMAKAAIKQAIPIQSNQLISVEWLIGL